MACIWVEILNTEAISALEEGFDTNAQSPGGEPSVIAWSVSRSGVSPSTKIWRAFPIKMLVTFVHGLRPSPL